MLKIKLYLVETWIRSYRELSLQNVEHFCKACAKIVSIQKVYTAFCSSKDFNMALLD